MTVPLLADLREPPVVGRYYMVPAVQFLWCDVDAWWPVLGPLHTDSDFFDFDRPHYHVDARFVRKDLASRAAFHREGIVSQSQQSPLARRNIANPVEVPTGRPALRRMKCQRTDLPYNFGRMAPVIALRAHYGDAGDGRPAEPIRRADGRLLCPHRKVDLSSMEPDADGIVTCPLHGLRVRCREVAA